MTLRPGSLESASFIETGYVPSFDVHCGIRAPVVVDLIFFFDEPGLGGDVRNPGQPMIRWAQPNSRRSRGQLWAQLCNGCV